MKKMLEYSFRIVCSQKSDKYSTMRFSQFKTTLTEALKTNISAEHLEGMKDLIARRIRELPDDESTAKALQEIEDMLQHLVSGGSRIGSIGKEILSVEDDAVKDAKKVLARLVLSIAEEVNATPEQKTEFFELWKTNQLVNVSAILDPENRGVSLNFSDVFTSYGDGQNPLITEFVNEVMGVSELGMGRGEFGLNVLSKSIGVSKGGKKDDEGGGKKGDLQITLDGKTFQVELKTEQGGAARFGDQEVRPAEGFESAAIDLNNYVKKHKSYKGIGFTLSGSGMNLNQAIKFHQVIPNPDKSKFLGLVRNCLSLIFGNIKGGRKEHLMRLKRNVNEIMAAVEVGDNGGAAQAYSQASFNFYMSRKHDDGVLYTNLNNKTFVYYDDAAQLLAAGLRFHASTPYISATKDPVRAVYPQISVQSTTFGGQAAQKELKQMSKGKAPIAAPDFNERLANWATSLANRRGVNNQRVINGMAINAMKMIQQKKSSEDIIAELERLYPQLAPKIKTKKVSPAQSAQTTPPAQKPPVQAPVAAPVAPPSTMQQPQTAV